MLGTNPYPFLRLAKPLVVWAAGTTERVIIQSGHTPITDNDVEAYPFLNYERLLQFIAEADVVISQGGFGSMQDCIRLGAKVVAIPRLVEFGECIDDQRELVDALSAQGLVIPLYDCDKLADVIIKAREMAAPEPIPSKLPAHLAMTLNALLGK